MANEVEINVVAHDRTDKGFAAAEARAKKFAATLTGSIGKAGKDAGAQLADGVDAGMQRAARDAEKRGQEVADKLGKGASRAGAKAAAGLVGVFGRTAEAGLKLTGTKGGAAVIGGLAVLPGVAGTIGGLTGAAFGAGLAGIGIAAAAQSTKVKNEFSDLKDDVVSGAREIAGPFEQSLLKIPTTVRRVGSDLKPYLAGVFADTAPAVDRFVVAIGKGVSSLGPSFRSLGQGFSTVLDAIGARAPEIFEDIGSGLETFAQLAVDHADDVAGAFKAISQAFESSADALKWFSEQFGPSADQQAEFTRGLVEAAGGVDAFRRQMAALKVPSAQVEGDLIRAGLATRQVGSAARDAAGGVTDLSTAFDDINSKFLNSEEAQTRFAEVLSRANKVIKENGVAWDRSTEAGIENHAQVEAVARAAQQTVTAMAKQKGGIDAAANAYLGYRESLVKTLTAAVGTRQEAERLAAKLLGMPKSVRTELEGDVSDLSAKIGEARRKLQDPKLTNPERAKIRADISQLLAQRNAAIAALGSIPNRTVTVTIREVINRSYSGNSVTGAGRAHGGVIGAAGFKAFQSGGISGAGSSTALVGEQGPELVRLPVGSTVVPAGQTAAAMSASAAQAASSISMAFRAPTSTGRGEDVSRSLKDLTKALRDVIGLREGMSRFTDHVLGQGRAFIAYEAALDRAAASAKKNGRTLNIGREKGRENRGALMDLASAAHEAAFAMADLGRPTSAIVARMKEQRAEFIRVARTMGLTAKQAKDLADKWGLIPSQVKSVLTKQAKDVKYNKAAEAFNKTLQTKASGGPAGGLTLVGERGPELVQLPFGSNVTTAGQTAAAMGGYAGGMGGPLHITLNIGGMQLGELILDPLRKTIRTRGGDVQAVLGRR